MLSSDFRNFRLATDVSECHYRVSRVTRLYAVRCGMKEDMIIVVLWVQPSAG
jgi:hypothetical protein